jgi:tRNA(fMet)-specific endonuclease VapC
MSLFVLDTDVLTLHRTGHPKVLQQVNNHLQDDLAITAISVEEQLTGWYAQLRRAKTRDQLARAYEQLAVTTAFLSQVTILSFPVPAILRYEQLLALKVNVGRNDLRIAAIALENGGILVTRNRRDFQRVPNLTIEDWSV